MAQQIWAVAQFATLMLSVFLGAQLPHSSMTVVLLVVLGTAILVPMVPRAQVFSGLLTAAPRAASERFRPRTPVTFRVSGMPGAPGTARARAPDLLVHAAA